MFVKILKLSEINFLKVVKTFMIPPRASIIMNNKKYKIINNSKSTSCIQLLVHLKDIIIFI